MCLGTTGRIDELLEGPEQLVVVAYDAGVGNASVAILRAQGEDVTVGDWVHVHMGFVLEKIDESHARESIEFQRSLERGEFPVGPTSQ